MYDVAIQYTPHTLLADSIIRFEQFSSQKFYFVNLKQQISYCTNLNIEIIEIFNTYSSIDVAERRLCYKYKSNSLGRNDR